MAKEMLKGIVNATKKPTKIYMDNSLVIVLPKNLVFHDRSKHIDIKFHYLWDCIANNKVEVKYVKTQEQVADIFTKQFKYDIFIEIRNVLEVMKKSSLKWGVESKQDFRFLNSRLV
jgi:hypothetical protein